MTAGRAAAATRRRRLGPRTPSSEDALVVGLSVAIGALAGLGAVAFRQLIELATLAATGDRDTAALLGHHPLRVLAAPIVAGLLYGPLISRVAPEARGHGVPEVMYAVHRPGGRIPARVAVVKALASGLCIGGGGSVGREGPIVQIGAAIGSASGQLARLGERRLRLLVACGCAGGIAATSTRRSPASCSRSR